MQCYIIKQCWLTEIQWYFLIALLYPRNNQTSFIVLLWNWDILTITRVLFWIFSCECVSSAKKIDNIKINPEPKPSPYNKFSISHPNLNSIFAKNFIKFSLLCAYIFVHNFNILRLSETHHDWTISSNLIIPGYHLYSA